ncbi:MAG: amidohydrolase [Pseudonocardiales bacterium]|nr:MAG: amidohydrolase [Pseudonocardiales bacterium]
MNTVLYRGGTVRAEGAAPATAMLVDGSVIAWVGRDDVAPAADTVVDLAGALVTPAFVDAHVHCTATGLALDGLDLSTAGTLAEALRLLETQVRKDRGAAVLGHGWDETRWPEGRPPTRQEVDRASYGGVVYLSRIDSHSAVVSSALLAAVPGARGLPGFDESGWLRQAAHHAVRRVARETLSAGQRAVAQRTTRRRAAELGIGCLHEMGGPDISGAEDLRALLTLASEEPGPEIIAYWGALGGIDAARGLGAVGAAGDLFVDGSIGSHTASVHRPYVDKDTCGERYLERAATAKHIVACLESGLQAGFHAIGDAAIGFLVNECYADAALAMGERWPSRTRHRMEHAEMVDDQLIARMAELGIVASVQPAFDAAWGGRSGMYARRLGVERALTMNPLAAMQAAGVVLALGSDSPVTPLDPWGTVRAAVHHRTPGAGITAEQAFAAHTTGGWRAAGRTGEGALAPGAPATFAVWAGDAIAAGATLPALEPHGEPPACLRTVVRGVPIHDLEGALG